MHFSGFRALASIAVLALATTALSAPADGDKGDKPAPKKPDKTKPATPHPARRENVATIRRVSNMNNRDPLILGICSPSGSADGSNFAPIPPAASGMVST